jgi:hypothetical protein
MKKYVLSFCLLSTAYCLASFTSPVEYAISINSATCCKPFALAFTHARTCLTEVVYGQSLNFSRYDVANDDEWAAYEAARESYTPGVTPLEEITNAHLLFDVVYQSSHTKDGDCFEVESDKGIRVAGYYEKILASGCVSAQRLVLRLGYAQYVAREHDGRTSKDTFLGCQHAQRAVINYLVVSNKDFSSLFWQYLEEVKHEGVRSKCK